MEEKKPGAFSVETTDAGSMSSVDPSCGAVWIKQEPVEEEKEEVVGTAAEPADDALVVMRGEDFVVKLDPDYYDLQRNKTVKFEQSQVGERKATTLLQPSHIDKVLDGVDTDIAVDDSEDLSLQDEDVSTSLPADFGRLTRQVRQRSASLGIQACPPGAPMSTAPAPQDGQTCGPPGFDVVRQGHSKGSRKRRHETAGGLSERAAKCGTSVDQPGEKLPPGCEARADDCEVFAKFVARYLRQISIADLREEAMLEIHRVLWESVRRQKSARQNGVE